MQDGHQVFVDRFPNICPRCGHAIHPLTVAPARENPDHHLEVTFQCPRDRCNRIFISNYAIAAVGYAFSESYPREIIPARLEPAIEDLSPSFAKIFRQASIADRSGLSEIAGMAYRKALEFLVKDFVISETENEAEHDVIKRENLGTVIATRVDDKRIKDTAKRAIWLANDETHYVRLWEGKDLDDLRKLLNLFVHFVHTMLLYKQSLVDFPEPKK